jgi:hypothetical protein
MPHRAAMRSLCALALLTTIATCPLGADGMTAGDRQRLVAHLEMTESWLISEIGGLSTTQLKYRATPESWSVMDVVEHLAVAEAQYWDQLQKSTKQPLATTKPDATDAGILWYGIDRTRRDKTGEARVPTGRWSDVKDSLAEFRKQRATMLQYARTSDDDLRGRKLIDGNMDVYQWFLMISSHSQRHILQVREIKALASFPKT